MCADPVTLAIIGTTVASTVMGGLSTMSAANANAKVAGMQAADALKRGEAAEQQHLRDVARLKGEQNAALAASGVELGYGSALDVAGDTADLAREDLMRIRDNANMEAWGYRTQQQQAKTAAQTGGISTLLDTGATLLTGASKIKKPGKLPSNTASGKYAPQNAPTYGLGGWV